MKRFFEKDSVLKIVSVFIALLVWLYVIYIEDPEIETTIDDVKITYNENEIGNDLSFISSSEETVDVKVKGNRSDIMALDREDISAVLDLSLVNDAGEYKGIKLDVSTSKKGIEIADISESKLTVEIDDIISRKFDIEAEFEGDMPDGYIITDAPYMSIESVWVKGARTYVEHIGGACIKIDCTRLSTNKTVDGKIYLKDKDGNIINKQHKAYKYLAIGEETVSAYIKVGKTTTATVEVKDAGDFEVKSISPEEIELYSADGSVTTIYTKSIKNKEPDDDGYITVKVEIPDNVTLLNPSQTIKIQVEKK